MNASVQNKAMVLFGVAITLLLAIGLFGALQLHNTRQQIAQPAVIVILGMLAAAMVLVVAGVFMLRRGVDSTARQLGSAAKAIATGDIQVTERSELGGAGRELESMLEYLRRTAALADAIASGNLTTRVRPLSEHDSLGTSLAAIADRIERLERERDQLEAAGAERAFVDPLTGLPSRRALMRDLEAYLDQEDGPDLMLALFDLDGFKPYNDAFSHPAGDALLVRFADRLQRSLDGSAQGYRMGGDEFCVLAVTDEKGGLALAKRSARALSEHGDAFSIGCSYGMAYIPVEAGTASDALRVADKRMYEQKMANAAVSRESTSVLLKVLGERSPGLVEHTSEVAQLASATARGLGLSELEVKRIELAAKLRDIGKSAIPDMILNKPGPLDQVEWEFMRRHTQIGARIIAAAPSLAGAADLVRSHHEWYDGHGYPDQLAGETIPIGAQIIAVCDAFGAMTGERPYRPPMSVEDALDELSRGAGTQFNPTVVRAFSKLMGQHGRQIRLSA